MIIAVFFVMGGLQVVGPGAISLNLEATKNATYRCKLNDGDFADCKLCCYTNTSIHACT